MRSSRYLWRLPWRTLRPAVFLLLWTEVTGMSQIAHTEQSSHYLEQLLHLRLRHLQLECNRACKKSILSSYLRDAFRNDVAPYTGNTRMCASLVDVQVTRMKAYTVLWHTSKALMRGPLSKLLRYALGDAMFLPTMQT